MQLAEQRAGGAEETEQQDPPRPCVAAIRPRLVVEIAKPRRLSRPISARVMESLCIMAKVPSTARMTKASDAALAACALI